MKTTKKREGYGSQRCAAFRFNRFNYLCSFGYALVKVVRASILLVQLFEYPP